MRRFILRSQPDPESLVRLEGADHRYLAKVLRLRPGDSFQGVLPSGEAVSLRVASVDGRSMVARAEIGPVEPNARDGIPRIILCQGLPKGQKMDLIVRQATEMGVSRIIPFLSRYSVPKVAEETARQRRERWERIVKEARQQSGSPVETTVDEPMELGGVLELWRGLRRAEPGAVGVFFHQDPLAQGTLHGYLSGGPGAAFLAVGPEGGFSGEEADSFIAEGFKPLRLGGNVLRAETAAAAALAAAYVLLLEREFWTPSNGSPA